MDMSFFKISKKSCLFINENDIFLFLYVDDILFAYRENRKNEMKSYKKRLCETYEIKKLKMNFFLKMRIFRNFNHDILCLMQNVYMSKLRKKYNINSNIKTFKMPLSYIEKLILFFEKIDETIIHDYKKNRINLLFNNYDLTRCD